MNDRRFILCVLTALLVTMRFTSSGLGTEAAVLKCATVFGNQMVLQRDRAVPIWGQAAPGSTVTVKLAGMTATTVTDATGRWEGSIGPVAKGGPYELVITDGASTQTFTDVLMGDVYLCSGQSNMGFSLRDSLDANLAIAAADMPGLRCFAIQPNCQLEPQKTFAKSQNGSWKIATPRTVADWSAVAFFFARELHQQTGVPIGIITASWGGTPIEGWTPRRAVQDWPVAKDWIKHQNELAEKLKADPKLFPSGPGVMLQSSIGGSYNGMIAPLAPMALNGIVWYQGEQNAGSGKDQYTPTLQRMISAWRADFRSENLPLFLVQLPNFSDRYEGAWPNTREAQLFATERLAHTSMAVTIDLGESHNIHPRDKEPVGRRVARLALARLYAKPVCVSGPIYESMSLEKGAIRIRFTYVKQGLISKDGGPLRELQIAGADQKFLPAQSWIDKDGSLLVWSDELADPRAVRYAWRNDPRVNLYNKEGLPASPFRTDDWPKNERSDWRSSPAAAAK